MRPQASQGAACRGPVPRACRQALPQMLGGLLDFSPCSCAFGLAYLAGVFPGSQSFCLILQAP